MKPRVLFFILPWLIILLVPQLRLPARVAVGGSEYVGDGDQYYARRSDSLLPWNWLEPSPPTLTELWRKTGSDPQTQIAVLLKAPQSLDFTRITFAEARQRYTKALQIAPRDAALLASALRLVADTTYERAVPPFASENAFPFMSAWWNSGGYLSNYSHDLPLACLDVSADDAAIWEDDFEPMALPTALPPLDNVPVIESQPVQIPSPSGGSAPAGGLTAPFMSIPNAATTPIGAPSSPSGTSAAAMPSGPPFNAKLLLHGPHELSEENRRHTLAAIEWARRGGAMEPDNAWWDWMMISFYYAARRDDEALRALHRASLKSHFDAHGDFERMAALRTAALHRPLLAEEKVSVWERQPSGDSIGYRHAMLLMWSLLSTKRSGQIAQALIIADDMARLGALMQREARTRSQLCNGLRLQSAAWAAIGGPVQRKNRTKANSPSHVMSSVPLRRSNYGPKPRATPLDFARQFASVARRAGRADLAATALRQAHEANRRQLTVLRSEISWYHVVTPDVLAPLRLLKDTAWMVLAQARLLLPAWLAVCFLLWPPLWKLGRPAAQLWRRFIVAWRGQTADAAPPADEPHEITRDVRAALWIGAALSTLCGAIALLWANDSGLSSELWPLRDHPFISFVGPACAFHCLTAPLSVAALWSFFAPLRRLVRVRREAMPPCDASAVLSLRPLLRTFVAWSAVFYAALSWVLSVRSGTDVLSMFDHLPHSWSASDGLFALLGFWVWQSWLFQLFSWMSDYNGAAWMTGAALTLWILRWQRELPPTWRWSVLHFALLRLRRTTLAWLPVTGWLFLIFLLASLPYRRAADAQFEQHLEVPQMTIEAPANNDD